VTPRTRILLLAAAVVIAATAARADDTTLTVGLLSEPSTLNPLTATATETRDIIDRIYQNLLQEQGDFINFAPQLASAWEFSADSLAITFRLRDDARWSDGEPVTAEDVRFTWEVQTDTLVAWHSSEIKEQIRDVEVIDPHTVVFHYSEHYPYQLMDANDGVILPRHLLASVPRGELATHAFGRSPVGCGPYRLEKWKSGQYVELVADDHFYGVRPVVDRLIFKFVPDMVTLMTQLKKGEIDMLESVPAEQQKSLREGYPDVEVYRNPSRRIDFVAWNTSRAPFSDARLRRALTMAIDRGEIIEVVWGGNAVECTSPIPSILWAYDPGIAPVPFDPDGARAELAALGWSDHDGDGVVDRDGTPLAFELITNSGNTQRADICTLVESFMRRVGVKVSIRTLEFKTVINKLFDGDYDACVFELKMATKVDITSNWHSSAFPRNGYNFSFYRNPEVDTLIERARVMCNPEAARPLWSRVQRLIYEDQPFTFLAVPDDVTALDRRFCNVRPNAISFMANVNEWKVGADCPH